VAAFDNQWRVAVIWWLAIGDEWAASDEQPPIGDEHPTSHR